MRPKLIALDFRKMTRMMMIAFITVKSSLLPLIEGLCAQGEDGDSRRKSYLFPKIFVTNLQFHQVRFFRAIGRSRVLGVPAELAMLHPIQNALGWHDLGFLCHGCLLKRRVAPVGAAYQMEGLERRRPWKRLYCNILNPLNRLRFGFTTFG